MSRTSLSRFRVRYAETDQMGVVYYSNYLIWMEIGRTDYCRECGFSYREFEDEEKAFIAVADARCRYIAPARYDDEIVVETRLLRVSRRIMEFEYMIRNRNGVVAEGRTLHVVLGPDQKPKAISEKYVTLLRQAF